MKNLHTKPRHGSPDHETLDTARKKRDKSGGIKNQGGWLPRDTQSIYANRLEGLWVEDKTIDVDVDNEASTSTDVRAMPNIRK